MDKINNINKINTIDTINNINNNIKITREYSNKAKKLPALQSKICIFNK